MTTFSKGITKDSKIQFPCLDNFEKVNLKYSNIATSCEKFKEISTNSSYGETEKLLLR